MDFKEKIVIITGGTSGIGLSIVRRLLTTDIKVIVLFELETPNSTQVFDELKKQYGKRIDFHSCDVTHTKQLEGNFDKVLEKYKTIDILINNAGIITENVPERVIDINYKAVVLGSLMMIERIGKHKGGKGGVIINVASILGLMNCALPIYCSTKHAVVSFTRTMKEQFDTTGVRMMAVCPGVTSTGMLHEIPNGLDFIKTDGILESFPPPQSPENFSNAVIHIIEFGESGDVWVAELDQAPYTVKAVEDYGNLRIK